MKRIPRLALTFLALGLTCTSTPLAPRNAFNATTNFGVTAAPLTTNTLQDPILLQVDGKAVTSDFMTVIGDRVSLLGAIPARNLVSCFAVHPLDEEKWTIQAVPSPPNPAGGLWNVRIRAELPSIGNARGKEYEVTLFVEGRSRNLCQRGKQFATDNFPNVPHSRIVTLRRAK